MTRRYSALRALERAETVLDPGTFVPVTPAAPEQPLVVGYGCVDGLRVAVALSDGHVRGGTIGVEEASAVAGLVRALTRGATAARGRRPAPLPLLVGFDTGGVRVQEGPRALAAASAVGVALARLTLAGVPLVSLISGPRGCFGAPAVMAALAGRVVITEGAHWALTGPKLLRAMASDEAPDAYEATSAAARVAGGDAHVLVADTPAAVRAAVVDAVHAATGHIERLPLAARVAESARLAARLERRFHRATTRAHWHTALPAPRRRRELLRYSFRGQWELDGMPRRHGLLQAAHGTLAGWPATALIVGPEQTAGGGLGIEEVALATEMIRQAVERERAPRAAIVSFLFCQGHALDPLQERHGLPRALAECLRAVVGARAAGHPVVSVLGGGTYGAVYLAFAAPAHRILALRGTSVAPMAPRVLRAFRALRGEADAGDPEHQLAELIPEVHTVASVIRLPRVLRAELDELMTSAVPDIAPAHQG